MLQMSLDNGEKWYTKDGMSSTPDDWCKKPFLIDAELDNDWALN